MSVLGEHINKIYGFLEGIEMDIRKIEKEVEAKITDSKKELETVKKTVITKSEFNEVLQKFYQTLMEFTPHKTPPQKLPKMDTSSQPEQEGEKV